MALIAQYLFNNNCNSETGNYNGTGSRIIYQSQPDGFHFGSGIALFDGWSNSTRSQISFPSYNFRSTWTIETWYRRFHAGNNDLFLHAGTTYGNYQMLHIGVNTSNLVRLGFYGNDLDAPNRLTDCDWHHLAFTYNSNNRARQIFIDGQLVASDTAGGSLSASTTWYIGWYNTDNNFCGALANLRIWNEVLSSSTIQSHYSTEKAQTTPQYSYNSTGASQTFTAPVSGYYKLDLWGAAGNGSSANPGGLGGFSTGIIKLKKDDILYLGVGGMGNYVTRPTATAVGGWNGGGSGGTYSGDSGSNTGSGGGATHIATATGTTGLLSELANQQSSVLIVAGGGGAGHLTNGANYGQGGHGGGYIGGSSRNWGSDNTSPGRRGNGGTQTEGGKDTNGTRQGSFGQGYNMGTNAGGGGGGGWYGGSGASLGSGGGGSGYIASSNLLSYGGVTKHMTGYDVSTSGNADTLTYSNQNAHYVPLVDNEMRAGGFVQITLIEEIVPPSTDFNTAALLLMLV